MDKKEQAGQVSGMTRKHVKTWDWQAYIYLLQNF